MGNNLLPFLFFGLTILFLVQCVPDTPTGNIVDIANPDFHLSKPSVRSIDAVTNFIEFTEGPQQNIDGYAIFEIKNGFSYLDNFTRVQPNGFFNTINTSEINDLQLAIASFIELPSDTDISHLQSSSVYVTSRTFNDATSYRVFQILYVLIMCRKSQIFGLKIEVENYGLIGNIISLMMLLCCSVMHLTRSILVF